MSDGLYRSHTLEATSSNGEVITTGTLTTWEDNPTSSLDVGDTFQLVPDSPILTVRKINISDSVVGLKDGKTFRQWQVSVEGDNEAEVLGNSSFLPDDEIAFACELNGTTARTVDGEFVALRRSVNPIKRITITEYSNSQNALAVLGDDYKTYGIAVSEGIVKETIKKDNVVIRAYYKHTIEVEQ